MNKAVALVPFFVVIVLSCPVRDRKSSPPLPSTNLLINRMQEGHESGLDSSTYETSLVTHMRMGV